MKLKKIIVIIGVLALVAVAVVYIVGLFNRATLSLSVDPGNATVTIDDALIQPGEIKLKPGTHTITAQAEGYITNTQKISLEARSNKQLAIKLLPTTNENIALTKTEEYFKKASPAGGAGEVKVLSATGFYDDGWVVAVVQATSEPGIVVLKRSGTDYELFMGPGTHFEDTAVAQLPANVASYLTRLMNGE